MMMIDQRESERDKNPPTFSAASFVCLIALSREYANTRATKRVSMAFVPPGGGDVPLSIVIQRLIRRSYSSLLELSDRYAGAVLGRLLACSLSCVCDTSCVWQMPRAGRQWQRAEAQARVLVKGSTTSVLALAGVSQVERTFNRSIGRSIA